MPLPSRSSRPKVTAVVEVGVAHVAVARFTGSEITAFAFRELPIMEETTGVASAAELAAVLSEVSIVLGRRESVTLVIPGHLALTKTIRVPATVLASAQRDKLIAFEARQNIPFPLEEVCWSAEIRAEHENEWEVLLVAAKSDGVRQMVDAATTAGFQVERVIPAGVALSELPVDSTDADLLVSIGARSTHLVFRAQKSRQLRTLSLAGQTVTRSIADALEQSTREAEQLKRGIFSGAVDLPPETPVSAAVQTAADAFAARLQLEIRRSLVTQVRQAGGATPGHLRLTGGGAGMPGLADSLAGKWRGTVSVLDPLAGITVASHLRSAVDTATPARLADLVGAFRAQESAATTINLAPPELGAARAALRRRPRWVLAAALLVVGLLLPGVHYHRLAGAREQASKVLAQRMIPVQALQDQNQRHLADLDRLNTEAVALRERVQARDAWTGLLADLQGSLVAVGDVWLERLEVLPPVADTRRSRLTDRDESADAVPSPPLRLRLSGRLLDRENPLSRVSQTSYERATALLEKFVESSRILEVEGERFDASEPGILRFNFTLVINPTTHL